MEGLHRWTEAREDDGRVCLSAKILLSYLLSKLQETKAMWLSLLAMSLLQESCWRISLVFFFHYRLAVSPKKNTRYFRINMKSQFNCDTLERRVWIIAPSTISTPLVWLSAFGTFTSLLEPFFPVLPSALVVVTDVSTSSLKCHDLVCVLTELWSSNGDGGAAQPDDRLRDYKSVCSFSRDYGFVFFDSSSKPTLCCTYC